ncbi:hypothetical protein [Aquimarina sp. I32.4]|uniref:hypothetical protein n=1 Tax=Aquimarina sp. I32.4 TaxID=2053903 RepID=UPI001304C59D|nr:hypothetical protein [Aquimarina sp. I32.4]
MNSTTGKLNGIDRITVQTNAVIQTSLCLELLSLSYPDLYQLYFEFTVKVNSKYNWY